MTGKGSKSVCNSCKQLLSRVSFSTNQWFKKGKRKRCTNCIGNSNHSSNTSKTIKELLHRIRQILSTNEYEQFKSILKHVHDMKLNKDSIVFKKKILLPLHLLFGDKERTPFLNHLKRFIPHRYHKQYISGIRYLDRLMEKLREHLHGDQYKIFQNAFLFLFDCSIVNEFDIHALHSFLNICEHCNIYPLFNALSKYIPSDLNLVYIFKENLDKEEYQDLKVLIKRIKDVEFENQEQFERLIVKPLVQLIPSKYYTCRSQLNRLKRFIPEKYADYYTKYLKNDTRNVHTKVINRVCNALHHNEKYGFFVALAFRNITMDECLDIELGDDICDIEQIHDYELRIFEDDEWRREPMRELVGYQLRDTDICELQKFVSKVIVDKQYDTQIFDDKSVKLHCNPLPLSLLNQQVFVPFAMKQNGCLFEGILTIIYEYLTGYIFNIEMPLIHDEHKTRVIECYQQLESIDKAEIKGLSLSKYSIKWTKYLHGSAMGRMNVISFEADKQKRILCCIPTMTFDAYYGNLRTKVRSKYYALLIKKVLDAYECDYENLMMIDIEFFGDKSVTQFFTTEEEHSEFEAYIANHCREIINPNVKYANFEAECYRIDDFRTFLLQLDG